MRTLLAHCRMACGAGDVALLGAWLGAAVPCYTCGARNNSFNQRGDVGSFLIDRQQRESTAEANPKTQQAATHC